MGQTPNDEDFYDVSLVDGYNGGLGVKALGGSGDCQYAGCVADLKGNCPTELRVMDSGSTVACKSACSALNAPEFCCTADHATPQTFFRHNTQSCSRMRARQHIVMLMMMPQVLVLAPGLIT